jgi:carbon storage regulator CsrA
MLVISRKVGQRIYFGDDGDMWLEVRRVAGNRVTLALEAPRSLLLLRGELRDGGEPLGGNQLDNDNLDGA